jgi:hypothetical protein
MRNRIILLCWLLCIPFLAVGAEQGRDIDDLSDLPCPEPHPFVMTDCYRELVREEEARETERRRARAQEDQRLWQMQMMQLQADMQRDSMMSMMDDLPAPMTESAPLNCYTYNMSGMMQTSCY